MGSSPLSKYQVTKVHLSKGAYAETFKAVEKATGKSWALKKFDKKGEYHRDFVLAEVEAMRLCPHPNIVHFKEFFDTKNESYIITEFCDHGELGDRIKSKGADLLEAEGAEYVQQMLSALVYLRHKNICHRDVKPSNLQLSGDSSCLKLTEFGVACIVQPGTALRQAVGTGAFKAPELYFEDQRNQVGYSFPVDMWAAGLTFYAIMTGMLNGPFFDETSSAIQESLLREGNIASFNPQFSSGIMQTIANKIEKSTQGRLTHFTSGYKQSARELCKLMVNPDQEKRITPEDALLHPWFQELGIRYVAPPAGAMTGTESGPSSGGGAEDASAGKKGCCAIS